MPGRRGPSLGRLGRRVGRRGAEPVAGHYARVLDGETLWLAVAGGPPAVTLRYAGGELSTPTEPEPDGLVSARVPLSPLAEVPGERLEVAVLAGEGRHTAPIAWTEVPAPGPVRAAIPTRDRRWRWRVAAPGGALGLVRVAEQPVVLVAGFVTRPDGVSIELADGRTVHVTDADTDLTVDGLPLSRAHDDLKRPNFAVALPELPDGTRLRWTPEGRLSLTAEVRDVVPRSAGNGASKSEEWS